MAIQTIHTLYVSELRDLYNSEQQIMKTLPKLIKGAESPELSEAFAHHLQETRNQVARLEQIFSALDENPKGKKCVGMEGILKESGETIDELTGNILDAALISAAQRVEHYEIAVYGTVCAYAELLGRSEDLGLLKETLEEEKRTDEKLTELSGAINREALENSAHESEVSSRPSGKATVRLRKPRSAA